MLSLKTWACFWGGMIVLANIHAMDLPGKIVLPEQPTPMIRHAAEELRFFLNQATGRELTVITVQEWDGKSPAMRLGTNMDTAAAGPVPDRRSEAWSVEGIDRRHIYFGGGERGVLYGVYEFLEHCIGIRFYGIKDTYVPQISAPVIDDDLKLSGTPSFPFRMLSVGLVAPVPEDCFRWYGRNRLQGPVALNNPDTQWPFPWGSVANFGSPNRCHTFGLYTRNDDFPKKPECFALNSAGKRPQAVDGVGPGQPCLTNPEVRSYFKRKLRFYIEADRKAAAAAGMPAPIIYDISANDNKDYCHCEACVRLGEKLGGPGGVDLDFVNAIADDIAQDYPDILISTFAYMYSEQPSRVKPRENVMIQLAQLGREYGGHRDTLRSLNHPGNQDSKKIFDAWAAVAPQLAIWDYGIIYEEPFPSPYTEVSGYWETFRYYHRNKVKSIYLETEISWPNAGRFVPLTPAFCDLKHYVAARCMLDVQTDLPALLDEFFRNFYGPAAKPMRQYLDYLERRQDEAPTMNNIATVNRAYLDLDFFQIADRFLSEAERLTAANPEYYRRVHQERYNVDYALLGRWNQLSSKAPLPWQREAIISRIIEVEAMILAKYFDCPSAYLGNVAEAAGKRLELLQKRGQAPLVPLPDFLKDAKVIADFTANDFTAGGHSVFADDSAAVTGKALRLGDVKIDGKINIHQKPYEFGVYDNNSAKILVTKVLSKAETPSDEKYHWLRLKNIQLSPKCRMWSHWSWGLSPAPLSEAYSAGAPARRCDIWISYKLTGPAYVPGSTSENASAIDRVIIVEAPVIVAPPLPEDLQNEAVVADFHAGNFIEWGGTRLLPDADACGGKAMVLGDWPVGDHADAHSNHQFEIGLYDKVAAQIITCKVFPKLPAGTPENYRWATLKDLRLPKQCRFWSHWTWGLTPANFDDIGAGDGTLYDVHVSYKLTGPAYVTNSTEKNSARIDRIVITKARKVAQ